MAKKLKSAFDLVAAKAAMFDLMFRAHAIQEGNPSLSLGIRFVHNVEDMFYYKQSSSTGVQFTVPIIKAGVCLPSGYDQRELVVNLQSLEDVFEEMNKELTAIENAIVFAERKEVRRAAAQTKARKVLSDEERNLLGLNL